MFVFLCLGLSFFLACLFRFGSRSCVVPSCGKVGGSQGCFNSKIFTSPKCSIVLGNTVQLTRERARSWTDSGMTVRLYRVRLLNCSGMTVQLFWVWQFRRRIEQQFRRQFKQQYRRQFQQQFRLHKIIIKIGCFDVCDTSLVAFQLSFACDL